MNKEFIEKAKDCKSVEEIKELAEKENVALHDEELKAVDGGMDSDFGVRTNSWWLRSPGAENNNHANNNGGGFYNELNTVIKEIP